MKCHTNLKAGGGLSFGAMRILASVIDAASEEPAEPAADMDHGLGLCVATQDAMPRKPERQKDVPVA
jgi:hypothetical protein